MSDDCLRSEGGPSRSCYPGIHFQIMTTTPIKYRVKPSTAFLKAGQSCVVTILVSRSHLTFEKVESSSTSRTSSSSLPELAPETVAAILLDKFIVNAISLNEDEANEDALTNSKLGELLKVRNASMWDANFRFGVWGSNSILTSSTILSDSSLTNNT